MDLELSVDFADLARDLATLPKQIQFATIVAATELAPRVQAVETSALPQALEKKPTPFTMKAFAYGTPAFCAGAGRYAAPDMAVGYGLSANAEQG